MNLTFDPSLPVYSMGMYQCSNHAFSTICPAINALHTYLLKTECLAGAFYDKGRRLVIVHGSKKSAVGEIHFVASPQEDNGFCKTVVFAKTYFNGAPSEWQAVDQVLTSKIKENFVGNTLVIQPCSTLGTSLSEFFPKGNTLLSALEASCFIPPPLDALSDAAAVLGVESQKTICDHPMRDEINWIQIQRHLSFAARVIWNNTPSFKTTPFTVGFISTELSFKKSSSHPGTSRPTSQLVLFRYDDPNQLQAFLRSDKATKKDADKLKCSQKIYPICQSSKGTIFLRDGRIWIDLAVYLKNDLLLKQEFGKLILISSYGDFIDVEKTLETRKLVSKNFPSSYTEKIRIIEQFFPLVIADLIAQYARSGLFADHFSLI